MRKDDDRSDIPGGGGGHDIEPRDPIKAAYEEFEIQAGDLEALARRLLEDRSDLLKDLVHAQDGAIKDPLTGLPNRAFFNEHFRRAQKEQERHPDRPCAVVIFDVDKFKDFNSNYTHAGGDAALVHVADIFNKNSRGNDIIAFSGRHKIENVLHPSNNGDDKKLGRLAGDEFYAVLPNTNEEQAKNFIARMERAVSESTFVYKDQAIPIKITGGFHILEKGDTLDNVKAGASKNMLDNKPSTRNGSAPSVRVTPGDVMKLGWDVSHD